MKMKWKDGEYIYVCRKVYSISRLLGSGREQLFINTNSESGWKIRTLELFLAQGRYENRGYFHLHCYLPFVSHLITLREATTVQVHYGMAPAGLIYFVLVVFLEAKLFLGNWGRKRKGGRKEGRREGGEEKKNKKKKDRLFSPVEKVHLDRPKLWERGHSPLVITERDLPRWEITAGGDGY